MSAKILPTNITSYDLLKTFAVLTMLIDHAGVFLFPFLDNQDLVSWSRVIGRMSFPVWFFLIGFANSRDITPFLIIAALLMIVDDIVLGISVFPIDILVSIILVRLSIDVCGQALLRNIWWFVIGCTTLCFLTYLTFPFFDYGAQAMVVALFGYFVRRQEAPKDKVFILIYMAISALSFTAFQHYLFQFESVLALAMFAGIVGIHIVLYRFEPKEYPNLTSRNPHVFNVFLRFCGRRTLEIYVVHYMAFKYFYLYQSGLLNLPF